MNCVIHDFQERNVYSQQLSDEGNWIAFYRGIWPNLLSCVRVDKDCVWQRWGVDRLILLPNGKQLSIDEKKRERNKTTGKLYDDFLLEEYSNLQTKKVGWTLDESKRTDFIAYSIPELGKCYLLPYEILRLTCQRNLQHWKTIKGMYPKDAPNRSYMTRNCAVEWPDLFTAMRREMHRSFGKQTLELPVPIINANQMEFGWGPQ